MSGFIINPYAFGGGGGGGGGIAIDASTAGGSGLSTSHDVAIPSGSGGLLVILMRVGALSGSNAIDTPSGWSKASSGSANFGELAVLYRVADGTEGATVAVDISALAGCAWVAYRVSGSLTTGTFIEATVSSISADDPPALTPSWGNAEALWLAVDSTRRTDNDITAAPTDYDGLLTAASVETSSTATRYCRIGAAHRVLTASSDDPGAFGRSGNTNAMYTATVAIRAA